jgi:spermidine/putrescine-binding protein
MKKNKKLFLLLTLTPFLGYLSSCSQSDTIIFANYQSYMNPDVMDKASAITNNNISFVSFEGDDEVQRKFANYYDVAIPSSCQAIKLLSQHLLDKINYPMFGIAGIDNGNDLKNLLNASTKKAVDIIDTYVDGHLHWNLIEPGATNPTILDFAIPYFLQD